MRKNQYLEYALDCLHPLGHITSKSMFGGYGLYNNGIIFALIINGELYFKSNKDSQEFYKSQGSVPFQYNGKKGIITINYWLVNSEVLEDADLLKKWFKVAYQAGAEANQVK